MDEKMNKEELLELLKTLKLDKKEFWVLSSGSLVLRGIFDGAHDLDIAVTKEGLKQLQENYNLTRKENGWYIVSDKIECICADETFKLEYEPEKCGDYYIQNIHEYLGYLYKSNREKDKARISLVEEYIDKVQP